MGRRVGVRGDLHRGRGLQPAQAAALRAQGPSPAVRQGRHRAAGGLEKEGFERVLAAASPIAGARFGFADEMWVGLRGTVRRVWCWRGVKVVQRLQLRYEWRYLFLTVDSRAGKLFWCWNDSLSADEVIGAVGGLQRIGVVSALV